MPVATLVTTLQVATVDRLQGVMDRALLRVVTLDTVSTILY